MGHGAPVYQRGTVILTGAAGAQKGAGPWLASVRSDGELACKVPANFLLYPACRVGLKRPRSGPVPDALKQGPQRLVIDDLRRARDLDRVMQLVAKDFDLGARIETVADDNAQETDRG